MGFRREFSMADLVKQVRGIEKSQVSKLVNAFSKYGDAFVDAADSQGNYENRTYNLRSSIGYIVLYNGEVKKVKLNGIVDNALCKKEEDKFYIERYMPAIASQHPEGIWLILFVGMGYGIEVESRGYNVISGSLPNESEFISHIEQDFGISLDDSGIEVIEI